MAKFKVGDICKVLSETYSCEAIDSNNRGTIEILGNDYMSIGYSHYRYRANITGRTCAGCLMDEDLELVSSVKTNKATKTTMQNIKEKVVMAVLDIAKLWERVISGKEVKQAAWSAAESAAEYKMSRRLLKILRATN